MLTDQQFVPEPHALPSLPRHPGSADLAAACTSPAADPSWWILHRLAAPQPFPEAGLPTSAAPMVGDRTWRRCRRPARP